MGLQLGKVVKSNSHWDYVVQVDDQMDVNTPPEPTDFGFGSFVKLESDSGRHWAVGLIYNSQLFNPMFLNTGPRLTSEPDPLFTPDLISDTRTLLGTVLIGRLVQSGDSFHGVQGIPREVVPVNTLVYTLEPNEIYWFHCNGKGESQFRYFSHLLRSGGMFAAQLSQQVLEELMSSGFFGSRDRRSLEILCKELSWKNTLTVMR